MCDLLDLRAAALNERCSSPHIAVAVFECDPLSARIDVRFACSSAKLDGVAGRACCDGMA
jgi:hypothetical protein